MNNHIVLESCKLMRSIARKALKENWVKVTVGFFIYFIFASLIPDLLTDLTGVTQDVDVYGQVFHIRVSTFASIYTFILSGVFSLGIVSYFMTYLRTRSVEYPRIFDGFSKIGKSFLVMLIMSIKIFLWALLFIIPGIIAAIRYSQSFYVLFDHPEYSASECINESKRLMTGNKEKYFLLVFSYIGWLFLAAIPSGLFDSLLELNNVNTIPGGLLTIISFVLLIPEFFVEVYVHVGQAVFYDLVTEKLVPDESENN